MSERIDPSRPRCRACDAALNHTFVDLGPAPLCQRHVTPARYSHAENTYPQHVYVCTNCFLVQLPQYVAREEIFDAEYGYFSSFSESWLKHAATYVETVTARFGLTAASKVVEIASNDGYLLRNFVAAGVPCLGIEPARNIAEVAQRRGIPTRNEFFDSGTARRVLADQGPADLILGNNVFAHVPDTNDFVAALALLLKPGGRVVLEFPYACDLIEHVEFDTIYHEHVFYFTLAALDPLFARHGLEVFDVQRLPIHGGSLRLSAAHAGVHEVRDSVRRLREEERAKGVESAAYYDAFAARVLGLKENLLGLLERLHGEGHRLCAYGASAKGSTLLNFYGLGRNGLDWLDFVVDRSSAKQGRLTPGSHLPILPVEELMTRRPRHALLLTWNFADEILSQQQAWRNAGGRFIVPLPEVRLL